MKKCPNCETMNADTAKFCKGCGTNIEEVEIVKEESVIRFDKEKATELLNKTGVLLKEGAKKAKDTSVSLAKKTSEEVVRMKEEYDAKEAERKEREAIEAEKRALEAAERAKEIEARALAIKKEEEERRAAEEKQRQELEAQMKDEINSNMQSMGGTPLRARDIYTNVSSNNANKQLKSSGLFIDPNEITMATIGANYVQNAITDGTLEKGSAILTNKRLYFKGKVYSGSGKNMKSHTEESVVSVEEITLTRFVYSKNFGLFIWASVLGVLGLLLLPVGGIGIFFIVAALVFLMMYFIKRSTCFEICFPGGKFQFDISYYPITDMQDFQREIHLVKDSLKNE